MAAHRLTEEEIRKLRAGDLVTFKGSSGPVRGQSPDTAVLDTSGDNPRTGRN